jgi:hypothetical protein
VQRIGASRFALRQIERQWRLAPIADLFVSLVTLSFDAFLNRLISFLWFLSNVIVMSAALRVYLETRHRILLLLIFSGALGAFRTLLPWFLYAAGSTVAEASEFYFISILELVDAGLWTTGFCLLMVEYRTRRGIDGLTNRLQATQGSRLR